MEPVVDPLPGAVGQGVRLRAERAAQRQAASPTTTGMPRSASTTAAEIPAMPPPTTMTFGAGFGATAGLADGAVMTSGRTPAIRPASLDTETMVTTATQLA